MPYGNVGEKKEELNSEPPNLIPKRAVVTHTKKIHTKIWKQLCLVITNKTFTFLKMERVDDGKAWTSKINISVQNIKIW